MKQTGRFLIYGATGFTGKLTARTAKERGLKPILAGRNRAKLMAVADPLGFQYRAFELSDPHAIDAALGEVDVVLHIAGPFSATSKPMTDACLRTGTHYLDITGEIDVFEGLAARDAEAKRAGIMLMPGVGFDVVPSDCLAAHLKQRLPDAIDLKIDIGGLNAVSHGTMKSMVESIPNGARVRRDGRIITVSRPRETSCDFGEGPVSTLVLPWRCLDCLLLDRHQEYRSPHGRDAALAHCDEPARVRTQDIRYAVRAIVSEGTNCAHARRPQRRGIAHRSQGAGGRRHQYQW